MMKANVAITEEAAKTTNYSSALSEFEQAASVDPAKHAAMKLINYRANANIAEVHYQLDSKAGAVPPPAPSSAPRRSSPAISVNVISPARNRATATSSAADSPTIAP